MLQSPIIPMVTCVGDPRSRGQQHGEALRAMIGEFVGLLQENVSTRASVKVTLAALKTIADENLVRCREYDEDLVEEIEGIAGGANQPIWHIALLNSFLELVDLRDKRDAMSMLGCTSFAATAAATADGITYVGQNYEMEAFYRKFRVLLKLRPNTGPAILTYSYAGVIGCAGLNGAGIGVAINFLHPRGSGSGVIYPVQVRKILAQSTIGNAVGAATIGRRSGGTNFLIADRSGLVFNVETAPSQHDILIPERGVFAHANHYVSSVLRPLDVLLWDTAYSSSIERRGSSFLRHHLANQWLQERYGSITRTSLFELCADHTNYPLSICCHGHTEDPELIRGETNASLLFDVSNRVLWLHPGPPCQTVSECYPVD